LFFIFALPFTPHRWHMKEIAAWKQKLIDIKRVKQENLFSHNNFGTIRLIYTLTHAHIEEWTHTKNKSGVY
jgi:hypothetical protein